MNAHTTPRARLRAWGVAAAVLIAALLSGYALAVRVRDRARAARDATAVRAALDARDTARAAPILSRWLAREPTSAEAHFLKGLFSLQTGAILDALRAFEQARALGHPAHEVERQRAFALVLSRRYAEAEPILRRLFQTATAPDPEVDEALARVFLQTYNLPAAAQVLDRWEQDAPNDPRPCVWHTEIDHRNRADPSVAIAHYREALKRDPKHAQARLGLANELRTAHRYPEAQKAYEEALAYAPNDPAVHVGAGLNALALNRPEEAARHLDAALLVAPDNVEALKERAAVDLRLQRYSDALARLDRVVKAHPFDGEAEYRRVILLRRLGRNREANEAQKKLDRLREDSLRLNKLHEQLNADPGNNDLRSEVARWLLDHGQADEGIRWAKTVLARAPHHAATNHLLADYHRAHGNAGLANYYDLQASGAPER